MGTVSEPRRIAVFGAGYIGLVTAACLAHLGHRVVVREIRAEKVAELNAGRVPLYEPGLAELLAGARERLSFTADAEEAVARAQVAYVCVDTPPTAAGDADLSRVFAVVESLKKAPHLEAVVVKSTVPVGTGARIRAELDAAGLAAAGYASNPEFTAEGQAVRDFLHPDRVVVGAWDPAVAALVADLHQGVDGPVVAMSVESAEMTKLAANALAATKISFINEIANVCEATGADIADVAHAVGMDHRLGPAFLGAGLGWGGSCFPKDSRALKQLASNTGYPFQLLTAVIEVNELQQRRPIARLKEVLGASLAGRTVAVLGMTFKPHTDDMRESSATILASRLLAEGAAVTCWDPMARPAEGAEPWDRAARCATVEEAAAGADAAILATAWPQLTEDVDWGRVRAAMRTPVFFDGRNALDPAAMRALGFVYLGVGRPAA